MSNKVVIAEGSGARFIDVFFLGIGLVIAGHSVYWSYGFGQGFWEFFMSTLVISVAYICLCLCLAEMISILPFSGGAYGFSRVTTGPYLGFIVGFFDSVSNIIYVSLFVRTCTGFFQYCFYEGNAPTQYDPLWWAILYVGQFSLHMLLQKHSFKFISFFGFICLMIPIIYILGTAHLQNFQKNVIDYERVMHHVSFEQGTKGFVKLLPLSSLMYFGIDMLCLVCEDTHDAVRVVPRVIMTTVVVLFVLAMALIVCSAAQYPTIFWLQGVSVPLSFGFADIFHTTLNYASIAVLPSQFIVMYALMYVYGRQICALSRSALVPSMFSRTTKENTPYMAILLGNVLGYISLIALRYGTANFDSTLYKMYYAAQMGSITVYIISMISFMIFRYKYTTLERHFVNIGGNASALIGISIFAFTWVALGFLQDDRWFIIKVYAALFGFATVYYYFYARSRQSFSQEEQSILFAVYIIKANSRHRTFYKKAERHLRHVMKFVDRDRSYFAPSGTASPKKSQSRSNSHRNMSMVSRIFPIAESSNDSKNSKPDVSTMDPLNEVVAYVEGVVQEDKDLDEKIETEVRLKSIKSSLTNHTGTTITAGLIEMQLIQEGPVIVPLDDIPHDVLVSPENLD